MKDIKCPRCGTLFGRVSDSEAGPVITIKSRDLYRHFVAGKVWGPCRGCGSNVEWPRAEDAVQRP